MRLVENITVVDLERLLVSPPSPPLSNPTPSININEVYKWWNKLSEDDKKYKASEYDESLFPFDYNRSDLKNDSNQGKFHKSWFILFAIAVFQQLGRVTGEQNSGFIKYLDDKEWLDTMVTTDDPAGWMTIIESFFESNQYDQEYNYWFKSIPELYIIRHHFVDYIRIFMNLHKIPENQHYDLQTILTPEVNPLLKGSGIHIPALNRTLKIGASLIIRELLRAGILNSQQNIIEHAFAPHQKASEIVFGDAQECTSREIYTEINSKLGKYDFHFDEYYDIPILLYRENES